MILAENVFSNKCFLMMMYVVFIMMYFMPRHNFRLAMKIWIVTHNSVFKRELVSKNYFFKLAATTLVVSPDCVF